MKVHRGQTQRGVLNLQGWEGSVPELQRQFDIWPISNLKEVKAVIPGGGIIQILPKPDND